jgi:HPt (histidine-containing phosphotransfer) domain-containing protein
MQLMTQAPQPPPLPPASLLDPTALQRLHELDPQGTQRVVERVLRAFDASLARLLPQSRQALEQGDHEAVRHVAHTLKSSSASVGAMALSRCCGEIENQLRLQQLEGLGALVATMSAEGELVRGAVRGLLPD